MYNAAMHVRAVQETLVNRHINTQHQCEVALDRLRAMLESGHARDVLICGRLAALELVTKIDHDCKEDWKAYTHVSHAHS